MARSERKFMITNGTSPDGTIFARGELEFPDVKKHPSDIYASLLYGLSTTSPLKAVVEPTPVVPRPTRILLSGNRTIVFWNDNTKTIVKQSPTEQYSVYAAFTAALAIKLYGSNSKLKKMIRDTVEVQKTKKPKPEPPKEKKPDFPPPPPPGESIFDPRENDLRPGTKVRMMDDYWHNIEPRFYPPKGTVGVYRGLNQVQWPNGSTSRDDLWAADFARLEVVED